MFKCTRLMPHYTIQQSLGCVFQCWEFVMASKDSTRSWVERWREKMLHNFSFDICGLQGGFTLEKREQPYNDYIRCTVGRDKILLMLVSGGVGSAVCAALLQGDDSSRVQAIHIENGFLRKYESEQVITSLQQLVVNPRVVEASLTFHDASTNVLGRQTLSLCRTENHHNDSEIVRQLRLHGRVVEPLQDFHKDEVRAFGRAGYARRIIRTSPVSWSQFFNSNNLRRRTVLGSQRTCVAQSD
ncbi:GMP synthase [glutamine-hydrolyzing]-like isoform X2 [Daphnia magna]|uniref:GMP synthase [glutamine-hydrolyzing]-like isoform X2 n=1 Tax=Daphnia magna TaxID=35525 RepID=UPI001E1BD815|nr:GMP synthase [glutamine-hydrolyzing]-like isoform X2 [Daphnia magna]